MMILLKQLNCSIDTMRECAYSFNKSVCVAALASVVADTVKIIIDIGIANKFLLFLIFIFIIFLFILIFKRLSFKYSDGS